MWLDLYLVHVHAEIFRHHRRETKLYGPANLPGIKPWTVCSNQATSIGSGSGLPLCCARRCRLALCGLVITHECACQTRTATFESARRAGRERGCAARSPRGRKCAADSRSGAAGLNVMLCSSHGRPPACGVATPVPKSLHLDSALGVCCCCSFIGQTKTKNTDH